MMKHKHSFFAVFFLLAILFHSFAEAAADKTPPIGSITINSGAAYTKTTSATLTLSASDASGVSQMCISNTTSCSSWETYATSKSWTLTTGDGTKTVYVWFKDKKQNANKTPYSDTIVLDATAPVNGTLSATAGNTQASLSWSGFSDATSGIGSYKLVYSTGGYPSSSCSSGTQIYSGTGTSYSHTGLTNGTTYYYRVCAIDKAQNTSSGATASAMPAAGDTTPPTGSITINSGAAYTKTTSATLTLSASDASGVSQMCISNTTSCSSWETYATSKSWTLTTGDGTKTVYAWYKDGAGNISIAYSDTIILDATAPINGTLSATAGNTQASLSWSGFSDATSGIGSYKLVYSTGGYPSSSCSSGAQIYSGTGTSYSHTGLTNGTTYYYRVCAIDKAQNTSSGATASAKPAAGDTTPPTGSITINSGAAYTKTTSATLTLSASDASGVSQMCISNTTSCSSWETYATSKAWTLTTGDGTKTVYAWYKDTAGNASATPCSDTIILDTTPPSSSIIINNNAAYTNTTSVTLTLSASDSLSGVSQMCISNTSSCTAWETYATSRAWTLTTGDGTKTVYVWYKDAAGNSSTSYTDTIVLDMTAPPVPTGLTATAVSSSQINQSWSAVVDTTGGSGLAGYKVYRSVTQIGTTAATNYSDYGLAANTQYCYRVASYDNAGNESGQCTQACATTQSGSQPGAHIWSERFGGTSNDFGRAVKADGNGNLIVAGRFMGTVDFGGGPLTNIGSSSLFVAKYTAEGAYLWSKAYGGTSSDIIVHDIALDSSGNVVVIGYFTGAVNFGGGVLTSAGLNDIFVVKYSGVNGAHIWSKRFGNTQDDAGYGVAVDEFDNVIVTGGFRGSVDFGGGALVAYASSADFFVAKYTASGTYQWSKRVTNNGDDYGYDVAIDGSGDILLTGYFSGKIDFGGGIFTSAGLFDIFIVKYSGAGTHIWSKRLGSTQDDYGYGLDVDGSGNVMVTGVFKGSVDFGGGPLSSAAVEDIFIAKYAGTSGAHMWSKRVGGSGCDMVNRIAVDETGDMVMTGYFQYPVDFGGGLLTSAGLTDIFVVKYAGTDGSHRWSKRFGSTGNDAGYGVTADGTGNVVATGYFMGSVDFGGGPLTSAGIFDMFLVKLAP